jgi:hypothetical protein
MASIDDPRRPELQSPESQSTQAQAPQPQLPESSSAESDGPTERRSEIRVLSREQARLKILRPLGEGSDVRVLNISEHGLQLRVPEELQPGTLVQIHLRNAIALAEVRYCVPDGDEYQTGVEFQDVFWTKTSRSLAEAV